MKEAVKTLFLSQPTLESFGCIDCRFVVNGSFVNLSLRADTDDNKSLLVEIGLTEKDLKKVIEFVSRTHRVAFIEADTLVFERKDFA